MRKALNENRKVQAGVIGVLAVLVVGIFYMNMGGGGGGGDAAPPPSAPPESADTGSEGTATDPSPEASAPAAGDVMVESSEEPLGPPLPQSVLTAYQRGDTVVLLVVGEGGIEDSMVRRAINRIKGLAGVSIYVVSNENIARYSRLTQGVGVSRVPALVVMRPRYLTEGPPEAQIHYGYLGVEQIRRAIQDANFEGAPGSYSPG